MPIYTVHEPPLTRRESRRGPERFVFVRDGFHFWAFLAAPLWMIRRGLWIVLAGYVVLAAAMVFGLRLLGVPGGVVFGALLLLSLLVGLEAASLRRWTLRRRKWREAGIVSADSVEAAERRFFGAWTAGEAEAEPGPATLPAAGAPPRRPAAPAPTGSDVVGLFPEPGRPQ